MGGRRRDPVLVVLFMATRRHYDIVGRRLRRARRPSSRSRCGTGQCCSTSSGSIPRPAPRSGTRRRSRRTDLRAVHVPFEGSDPGIQARFFRIADGKPHLEVLPAEEDAIDAVLDYIWELPHGESDIVTVVIPELFRRPSLLAAFLRRTTFSLKLRLLSEPGIVITDVPACSTTEREGAEPARATCVVPIAGVSAVSLRAVRYAETLGLRDTHALYLAYDDADAARMRRTGCATATGTRSRSPRPRTAISGAPLLAHLPRITADPEAMAVVVMPELVVRGVDRISTTSARSTSSGSCFRAAG